MQAAAFSVSSQHEQQRRLLSGDNGSKKEEEEDDGSSANGDAGCNVEGDPLPASQTASETIARLQHALQRVGKR
jgi:hypothetical protein